MAAVYAVPSAIVGDDVMAAVLLREDSEFDPEEFLRFLAAQKDLGTKWAPRYVRVARQFPVSTDTLDETPCAPFAWRAARWLCGRYASVHG